jgi:RhoGAP domain
MTGCSPGDLDPHAVASVFKAYLRERMCLPVTLILLINSICFCLVPESILTQALLPSFDTAIKKEAFTNLNSFEHNRLSGVRQGNSGHPGLPQGPKSGFSMRKPPSLSTLAMPTFSGIPPPSTSLVADIKSLISQLPQENYDLLRTVVDLIKATEKARTMTKMPLSNLMLVFCPSLNMAPPLLKVFCEVEDIWVETMDSPPPPLPLKNGQIAKREADITDSSEENDEEEEVEGKSLMSSGRASLDTTDDPSSGYHASAEEESSLFEEGQFTRKRYLPEPNTERSEIPTIYLDTMSHYSSSFGSLRESLEPPGRHHHRKDSTDDEESLSPASGLVRLVPSVLSRSTPLCSSSVESLTSDVSTSLSQLPVWDDGSEGRGKIDRVGPVEIVDPDLIPISSALTPTPTKKGSFSHASTSDDDDMQSPRLPNTPLSVCRKRLSIPVLSLPNFPPSFLTSSGDGDRLKDDDSPYPSPISGVNMLNKRSKRPSLRLLFSKNKKSGSSLNSLGGSGNGMVIISNPIQHVSAWDSGTSDSSSSTPISAVTAASGMSSLSHLPPVLNTPIDGSPLRLDLGFGSPPQTAKPDWGMREHQELATSTTPTVTSVMPSVSVMAESTNLEEILPQIASASQVSTLPDVLASPMIPCSSLDKSPSISQRSSPCLETPSSDSPQLSLLDNSEEEDWTQSVLSAADRLR